MVRRNVAYIVRYSSRGVRITLRFAARSFPRHALIAVTDTITNMSNRHLATIAPFDPAHSGPCRWPIVALESVNAQGQAAEPIPPVPIAIPLCPAPPAIRLPIGKSRVEHQLAVLWTPRLVARASLYNVVHRGYWGFDLKGPAVRFRLRHALSPTITLLPGRSNFRVAPPPGAGGTYYYESWGRCTRAAGGGLEGIYYWAARTDRTISTLCAPAQWYVAAGWLNHPIATLVYPGP